MNAISSLFKYIRPHWKAALTAPVFMVLEVLFDLVQPWLMQKTIDVGIGNSDAAYVLQATLTMIGVAAMGFLCGSGGILFSTRVALAFATDLRRALFEKILSFSSQGLDKQETGPLITRLTDDISQTQNLVMNGLRLLIRAPLTMIGALVMAILTSPQLSPIMLVMIPLLSLILFFIIRKAFPRFRQVQDKLDSVNAIIQESINGIRVIKSFVRETHQNKRFETRNAEMTAFSIQAGRMVSLIFPFMFLMINLGVVSVIWFGGLNVISGVMKVGQVVAFINYLLLLLFSLMMMGMVLMNVSRAEASASRIMELFNEPTPPFSGQLKVEEQSLTGRLSMENVSFCFGAGQCDPILRDISFNIQPGETVAVLGVIGSGKTTLLHLIPRLLEPVSGVIRLDGIDIREMDPASLRARIGLVHQSPLLFTGTIADNIRFGNPEASEAEILSALESAQAMEFVEKLPDGLNHIISQKGKNLSGGQKQRLAIARALVREPFLLLLDDCTSALDSRTEEALLETLRNRFSRTTLLMVVQRIRTARNADKILLLEDGRIAGFGDHAALLRDNRLYQDIYDSQKGHGEVLS